MTPKPVILPSVLNVSMRPNTLASLYGQDSIVKAMRNHMAKRPPRTWLFTGPPGSGKTTLATILATSLNCTHQTEWGNPCPDCVRNYKSFSIHEINGSDETGKEEIGNLVELSNRRPLTGNARVFVIDECHRLSAASWSLLLTPTEKPPLWTTWIFCTSEAQKVPAANKRRCTHYAMQTLSIDGVEAYLKKCATAAKTIRPLEPLFELVHTLGICTPGNLLPILEKYAAGVTASEAVVNVTVDGGMDTFGVCKAVTAGDWRATAGMLEKATPDVCRYILACVRGYLKSILLRSGTSTIAVSAAKTIKELSMVPYDDGAILPWLCANLFEACIRFKK